MSFNSQPFLAVSAYLMLASVVCGVLVIRPGAKKLRVAWLHSASQAKRISAYVIYFFASFLLPFSFTIVLLPMFIRITGYEAAFLLWPVHMRVLFMYLFVLPAWILLFLALLRLARSDNTGTTGL